MKLKCISCSREYPIDEIMYYCKSCNDLLEVVYEKSELGKKSNASDWRKTPLSVWRYHPFLPFKEEVTRITLNEGGTGLHRCERLAAFLGLKTIYIKNEGENPTGSFKDRGMTVGVSKALELGVSWVICASTGNTSASLAAYAARAGLKRIVLIPSGKVAYGKLAQAMMCGAQVVQVRGNFDEALEMVMDLAERYKEVYLLNSVNPFRLEGQKTLAFEVCEQLGHVPDWIIVPVGNAGNISAIWKGLQEFKSLGYINKLPRMVGVQAAGAAPIADAFEKGSSEIKFVEKPETIATAIRI
jgi:threonine synthase